MQILCQLFSHIFFGPSDIGVLLSTSQVIDILEEDKQRLEANNGKKFIMLPHADLNTEIAKQALCHCIRIADQVDALTGANGRCEESVPNGPMFQAGLDYLGTCHDLDDFVGEVRKYVKKMDTANWNERTGTPLGDLAIKPDNARAPIYYTYMCALDADNVAHFLPTYLTKITPPKDFKAHEQKQVAAADGAEGEAAASKHEDRQYMPQAAFEILKYVQSFEFCEARGGAADCMSRLLHEHACGVW